MTANYDETEVSKFDELARKWWDTESEFKPLHQINPLRTGYIADRVALEGKRVLDVGCGGGILSESLAKAGAIVTGIDVSDAPLNVAKLHKHESGLEIDYRNITVEELSENEPGEYDVITCLEMLEHVPDPESIIAACRKLLKPDGDLFVATINRNPKSYLLAIIGAEYVLGLLPRGTHRYEKLIKPSEMAVWLRHTGFRINDITGMTYNPVTGIYKLSRDTDVNYLVHASVRD
ncbi:MAG: bifunctional 2-polyprenyl-6-hydroxyphenol methylase/3-demethylubiquinol 3-O-methyltransferase UbiG [Pseudomonadales bacterium]